ncbi:MAG: hypothetical protein JWR21_874 [Herminiimonas sp.]|nr:hypothetical protein [Herminiimonas sp.]
MAGNDFKIIISAQDKATASIKRINDSISKLTRPFEDVQKSMASVGKELSRNPVVRGLRSVEKAAGSVASSIAKIAPPMAALVGVGTIAGIGMLVTEWGKLGFELSKTSSLLDVSASSLHTLRGAAQLAGVSSEELTGGLSGLQTTLQDARWGRNNAVAGLMSRLGMSFHQTANGSVDVIKSFEDIADAIAAQKDVGAKHTLARSFGVEAELPYLMKSREERRKLREEAQRLNPFLDPKKAEAYAEQIFKMDLAMSGLKNTIGSSLIPVLQPLVQQFTEWVALNQKPIGENLGVWVKKMADYFKSGEFDATLKKVESVGNALVVVAEGVLKAVEAYNRLRPPDLPDNLKYNSVFTNRNGAARGRRDVSGTISGTSTAGGASAGNFGMHYNDPALDAYANLVEERNGLPKNLLNGIKNFGEKSDPGAVSPKGARGVMQFMPGTWGQYGKGDPSNPYASIDAGGAYLKDLMKRYNGNVDASLTEYNGGTKQAQAVAAGGQPWAPETKNYLSRVHSGMEKMNGSPQEHNFTMTIAGLPAGTSATVKNTTTGQNMPVRVATGMPQMSMP